jgi:hypothetical protein
MELKWINEPLKEKTLAIDILVGVRLKYVQCIENGENLQLKVSIFCGNFSQS